MEENIGACFHDELRSKDELFINLELRCIASSIAANLKNTCAITERADRLDSLNNVMNAVCSAFKPIKLNFIAEPYFDIIDRGESPFGYVFAILSLPNFYLPSRVIHIHAYEDSMLLDYAIFYNGENHSSIDPSKFLRIHQIPEKDTYLFTEAVSNIMKPSTRRGCIFKMDR